MSRPIKGRDGNLVFPIGPKNTNFVVDVVFLLPVKFLWIPFSDFREEVENFSANQRTGRPSFFPSARKTQTLQRTLRSCFLSSFVEFCSAVSEKKSKMSRPIRGQGGHLVFPIGPKNTNLAEDVAVLLPVKFRWIPFSGFREEVENEGVDDGQRVITIVHLSLWPRCSKTQKYFYFVTNTVNEHKEWIIDDMS